LIFACLPARERREKHAYAEQSSKGLSTFQRAAHFPLPPRTQNNPTSADCPNAKKLAPFKFKEPLRIPFKKNNIKNAGWGGKFDPGERCESGSPLTFAQKVHHFCF
jgi:hypothetical protein